MKAIATIAIPILAFTAAPTMAQQQCVGLSDDAERLACFDAAVPDDGERYVGNWRVIESVSGITDERTIIGELLARDLRKCEWEYEPQRSRLSMGCVTGSPPAIFALPACPIEEFNNNRDVTYRIDRAEPVEVQMTRNTEEAIGYWDQQKATALIERIGSAKRFVFRHQTSQTSQVEEFFDVAGAEQVIQLMRQECPW